MPEGVEVKIITEQLRKVCVGQTITQIETVIGSRYRKVKQPEQISLEGFTKITTQLPLKILDVNCKGKFIYWELEQDWYLFNTLGMTGCWSQQPLNHQVLRLEFSEQKMLYFCDARHFGTVKFVFGDKELNNKLGSLGADIFGINLTESHLAIILWQNRHKTLAEILMNQKNLAGIGNYIKSEVLYRAEISPWRLGSQVSGAEIKELVTHIKNVAMESYQCHGATLATYKDTDGQVGTFAQHLRVYKKEFCPLGHPIKSEETRDKRTSWWVPTIQT